MKITFLGTGTSTGIPIIGCGCDTCTSTDEKDKRLRASIMVDINNQKILIDCGPDLRQQLLAHKVKHLDAVLITHEHYDHLGGLDDLRPLGNVNVYAEKKVNHTIERNMSYCFSEKRYPGVPTFVLNEISEKAFEVYQTNIQPIRVMHAQLPILGFRIGNMAYLTDVKTIDPESIDLLKNLDVLIINALRHIEHISHITLQEAIRLAEITGAKRTFFTHMSHDMGRHELIAPLLPANIQLAFDGMEICL